VQSFVGVVPKPPQKADDDEEESYYGKGQGLPTMKAGLNQFEWDLRYTPATSLKGMIIWGARPQLGPLAPPGKFQVRLTAGGKSQTHNFEIMLDPRLKGVSEDDVKAQFKLALELRDKTSKANDAVIKIRDIKSKLKSAGITDQQLI